MEENIKKNEETKKEKLSYEELETVTKQFAAQLEAASRENSQLKKAVQTLQVSNLYTELEFRFKVLQNADMFSTDFVEQCVKVIEETMTPQEDVQADEQG